MALEDVQNFFQALENNEELAIKADDAFVNALHTVATSAGYEFSESDLRSALDGDGLSDADLDAVAGGAYLSGATMNTVTLGGDLGGAMDTVFGGTSTSSVNPTTTLTRFSSFSRFGFSR